MPGIEGASIAVVVCDSGPLIHLDEIGCLHLLSDFGRIVVPNAVWQEVSGHRPAALTRPALNFQRVAPSSPVSAELDALIRLLGLHRGEQEALQVAQNEGHCVLLTDDTAARLAARTLKLPVHGTIGILVRAIRRQQKSKNEVLALLRSLPSTCTLYIRPSLLEEMIRQVENSADDKPAC